MPRSSARRTGTDPCSVLHAGGGPWSNCAGFDEVGAAVTGLFSLEGSPSLESTLRLFRFAITWWLARHGRCSGSSSPEIRQGGSYRVTVSLTRTCCGCFRLAFSTRSMQQLQPVRPTSTIMSPPICSTPENPLGTYQGMTDQVVMSRTRKSYRMVLVPHGSSQTGVVALMNGEVNLALPK